MKSTINRKAVFATITRMNWHYGKGNILRLMWQDATSGSALQCIYITQHVMSEPKYRRFFLLERKGVLFVRFLGKTRKVRSEP